MYTLMYYPRKRYGRRPSKKVKRSIYKKKVYRKKNTLVKTIKSVVHRMTENKSWVNYAANQPIQTNVGSSSPFSIGLLPTPSQGATQQ